MSPYFGKGGARAYVTSSTDVLLNQSALPGNYPAAVDLSASNTVYDPERGLIFGGGHQEANLSVVSDVVNRVVRTVSVPSYAGLLTGSPMAFVPSDHAIYYTTSRCTDNFYGFCLGYTGDLVELNDSRFTTVATVAFDTRPSSVSYDPAKGELFVSLPDANEVAIVNVANNTLVTTVPVGLTPTGGVYAPELGEVFVADAGSDLVSVINDTSGAVVAQIPVGHDPVRLSLNAALGRLYVVNNASANVTVLNASSHELLGSVPVGDWPQAITVDPRTSQIFVSSTYNPFGSNNVTIINATTDSVVGTAYVGYDPSGLTFDAVNRLVYVANWGSGNLSLVSADARSDVGNVSLVAGPDAVVFDPATDQIFVGDYFNGVVDVLNAATGEFVSRIPAVGSPFDLTYDSAQHAVLVSSEYPPEIFEISDQDDTVVANWTIYNGSLWNFGLTGLAYDSQRGELFVGNGTEGSANVTILNATTGRVVANVAVGSIPYALAYDRAKGEVFVANYFSSNISAISDTTNRVVRTITTEGGYGAPDGIVYDPVKGELFVADGSTDNLSIINDTTDHVAKKIDTGSTGLYLAYDPADRTVVEVQPLENEVAFISDRSNRVVDEVPVGAGPTDAAFDSLSGAVFTSNQEQGTVSILTPINVVFRTTGLPIGSNWSVTIGSPAWTQSNVTVGRTGVIAFSVPTGPLTFSVTPPPGYGLARVTGPGTPSYRDANISGPTVLTLHFGPIERLSFVESGLPPGTLWSVSLRSAYRSGGLPGTLTNATNGSALSFTVVRGPWVFSVSAPSPYVSHPPHGSVTVYARWLTKSILFRIPR